MSYSETSRWITISFTNVPEFIATGANTFSFTLFAPARGGHHHRGSREDSSRFTIAYGDMTAMDGLAGYSCGGLFNSGFEQERDLSRLAWCTIDGEEDTAIFEAFTALDNDLDNRTLRFIGPEDFRDPFEPNAPPPAAAGAGGATTATATGTATGTVTATITVATATPARTSSACRSPR